MPWCHTCEAEFVEGVTSCADCGGTLSAGPPQPKPEKERGPAGLVLLADVDDGVEAGLLEGLLRQNDIPFVKRHREAGEYISILMGRSAYGVGILVDERDYERARELLAFLRPGGDG